MLKYIIIFLTAVLSLCAESRTPTEHCDLQVEFRVFELRYEKDMQGLENELQNEKAYFDNLFLNIDKKFEERQSVLEEGRAWIDTWLTGIAIIVTFFGVIFPIIFIIAGIGYKNIINAMISKTKGDIDTLLSTTKETTTHESKKVKDQLDQLASRIIEQAEKVDISIQDAVKKTDYQIERAHTQLKEVTIKSDLMVEKVRDSLKEVSNKSEILVEKAVENQDKILDARQKLSDLIQRTESEVQLLLKQAQSDANKISRLADETAENAEKKPEEVVRIANEIKNDVKASAFEKAQAEAYYLQTEKRYDEAIRQWEIILGIEDISQKDMKNSILNKMYLKYLKYKDNHNSALFSELTQECETYITYFGEGLKVYFILSAAYEQNEDYDKTDDIYQKSLKLGPDDAYLNNIYANFLSNISADYDGAEKYYQKALKLKPDDADINGDYANFLKNIREDYDGAEEYYPKALILKPDHAYINGNYANFLSDIREDYDEAEKFYRKAIELKPNDANINGNYAVFLSDNREDYDGAEKYYRKALELNPVDAGISGNYANFLKNIRKNYDIAEKYYRKALDLKPDLAVINSNFAIFLSDIRENFDEAEQYYQKALELKPDYANCNSNYTKYLIEKGALSEAKDFLSKSFKLNSGKQKYLDLELWFYSFSVFYEEYPKSKVKIEALLSMGVRSKGWFLDKIVAVAEKQKHPEIEKVCEFAIKISE